MEWLLKLIGIGVGASAANTGTRLSGYAFIGSIAVWALADWNAELSITATRGFWFILAAIGWFVLELAARSRGPQ